MEPRKTCFVYGLFGAAPGVLAPPEVFAEPNSRTPVPVLTEVSKQSILPKFRLIRELITPGPVSAVLWNSDGTKLAASSLLSSAGSLGLSFPSPFGNLITIWDDHWHVFKTITRTEPFFELSDTFAFVGNNRQIAAPSSMASSGLAFSVFDLETGVIVRELPGSHSDRPRNVNAARAIVASPDQLTLAVTFGRALAQPVALYSTRDWSKIIDLPEGPRTRAEMPEVLAFSKDGKLLAVGRIDGVVLIYDVDSRQVIQRIDAYERGSGVISSVAFNSDATSIAMAAWMSASARKLPAGGEEIISPKNLVRVFRVKDAARIATYGEPFYPAGAIEWTRDGKYLVFITATSTLHLWDPSRPLLTERTIELGQGAFSLAFSPSGESMAVGVGNSVKLFRLEP